jgi:DNA-binding transcriptional MerR regulator
VGERSYLAIGDVLALLREEFPDVTISKIRFLESRGLLDPERTPSGYRKFYEPDVDRLRWILRQQREHFLPLKVIKGRLENGMTDPDAPTPHLFEMGDPPPEREPQPVLVGVNRVVRASEEHPQAPLATLAPIAAAAAGGDRLAKHSAPQAAPSQPSPPPARAADAGPTGSGRSGPPPAEEHASPPHLPDAGEAEAANSSPSRRRRSPSAAAGTAPHPATPQPPDEASCATGPKARDAGNPGEVDPGAGAEAGEAANEEPKDAAASVRRGPTRSTAGLPGAGLSGASLTLVELAHASGLELSGVEELESFGLIAGRTVAGVHCYDEEAVLVAKLAARFATYGIEARHLKVFKHASDRQTGLFSQVVTPLLRQRNPEARARAIEDLSELAELGESLMRCFSQATLRELTGG